MYPEEHDTRGILTSLHVIHHHVFRLHAAAASIASSDVVELLIEANSSSAGQADEHFGFLPLHFALSRPRAPDVTTVRALLKACPSGATVAAKGCSLSFGERLDAAMLF